MRFNEVYLPPEECDQILSKQKVHVVEAPPLPGKEIHHEIDIAPRGIKVLA